MFAYHHSSLTPLTHNQSSTLTDAVASTLLPLTAIECRNDGQPWLTAFERVQTQGHGDSLKNLELPDV